jgi:predicted nucleic acid-binding protein
VRVVVLDASVLVACLFKDGRARSAVLYAEDVAFVVPPGILSEVERQLPRIALRAGISRSELDGILELLRGHLHEISLEVLRPFEADAKGNALDAGDVTDWEYVALALALDAPVWTYDRDFRRMRGVRTIGTTALDPFARARPR